uniref:Cytochrome c4 n=1 Tax=uncultured bacterium B19D1_C12D4_E9D6 TaxID=1329637 RepID=S4W6G4_9BACT|nr:cytochrome c4 [uncultured bacterium B19D1_C12D4_E9D6]
MTRRLHVTTGFDMTRMLLKIAGAALLVGALSPSLLLAQSGDAAAGQGKAAACAACHGQNGVAPSAEFPSLAGQVPGYIATQLRLFKDKERENAIMAGMVIGLSEQDMADLDAFYSSQPAIAGSITPEQEEQALAGRALYRSGNADYQIPACMSCHAPDGAGIAPKFPRLAGQSPVYIKSSLLAYKDGRRKNNIMSHIAFPLSMEQIEALTVYISGLN